VLGRRRLRAASLIEDAVRSCSDLGYFADWRSDLAARGKDLEVSFFPNALWEDLNGLCLGLACTGQGSCEHSFNKPR